MDQTWPSAPKAFVCTAIRRAPWRWPAPYGQHWNKPASPWRPSHEDAFAAGRRPRPVGRGRRPGHSAGVGGSAAGRAGVQDIVPASRTVLVRTAPGRDLSRLGGEILDLAGDLPVGAETGAPA